MLTVEQKALLNDLELVIEETGTKDIVQILGEAKTEDLFAVFKLYRRDEEGDEDSFRIKFNLLFDLLIKNEICTSAVFDMVKKRNILKEFLSIDLIFIESANGISENYRIVDFIVESSRNITGFLDSIKDKFGLKEFWKALPEDSDRNMIKGALEREIGKLEDDQEKSKCQGWLKEIAEIEYRVERKIAANKADVTGAICGVIAGLAVFGGLFAAGAQLPILALIGIAVAAGLVTGLVAAVITYAILKPSEKLDSVDAEQHAVEGADLQHS